VSHAGSRDQQCQQDDHAICRAQGLEGGIGTDKMRIVRRNLQTRNIALLLVTGFVVSWVTHGLETQWKSFPSWWLFFGSWLIHTIGVVALVAVVGAAIVGTHRFFLGSEHNGDHTKLTFYVVVTVLIGAICVALIALGWPSIWELW
jgi:hypothetical protein